MIANFFKIFVMMLLLSFGDQRRAVKITNFICKSFDEKVAFYTNCSVKAISRDIFEVNVHARILQIPVNKIWTTILLLKRGNVRSPLLYNVTIDVCEFQRNRQKYPLALILYQIMGLDRFSNMNHECPYTEDVYVRNYRMDDFIMSRFVIIPLGDYSLIINWVLNDKMTLKNEISLKYFEQNDYKPRKAAKEVEKR